MTIDFQFIMKNFWQSFGDAKFMTLATCSDNRVTARTLSCINVGGALYFQTDRRFYKMEQIRQNPRVALCADNVSIEGIAESIGHPMDVNNAAFINEYIAHYKESFERYSALPDEIVVRVAPVRISVWSYEEGKPYRAFYDLIEKTYLKELYI